MILLFGLIHGVPAEKGSVGILATSEAKFSASVVAAGLRKERWHHPAHQVWLSIKKKKSHGVLKGRKITVWKDKMSIRDILSYGTNSGML